LKQLEDRAFEVAWFFKMDPGRVLDLSLSGFARYEGQASRLAPLVNQQG
jgi:hypothetical protein